MAVAVWDAGLGGAFSTSRSPLLLRTDQREEAERAEPMESTEPAEKVERVDPTDAIDRAEPTDPMLRTDPTDPIDRIDPRLAIERNDLRLAIDRNESSDFNGNPPMGRILTRARASAVGITTVAYSNKALRGTT